MLSVTSVWHLVRVKFYLCYIYSLLHFSVWHFVCETFLLTFCLCDIFSGYILLRVGFGGVGSSRFIPIYKRNSFSNVIRVICVYFSRFQGFRTYFSAVWQFWGILSANFEVWRRIFSGFAFFSIFLAVLWFQLSPSPY